MATRKTRQATFECPASRVFGLTTGLLEGGAIASWTPEPAAVRGKFTLGEEVRSCSTEAAASGPPADELRSTPGAVHHRSGQEDCDCGGPSRDDSLLTLLG